MTFLQVTQPRTYFEVCDNFSLQEAFAAIFNHLSLCNTPNSSYYERIQRIDLKAAGVNNVINSNARSPVFDGKSSARKFGVAKFCVMKKKYMAVRKSEDNAMFITDSYNFFSARRFRVW